jgi:homoserine O-acetyltransferase/O-succinyltransferase
MAHPISNPASSHRLHKLVLDTLGVSSVAVAIGGSMGGMAVLEWPLCTPPGFIRHIIPIATSARHSAWCISWGEAQRQSIYSDPGYNDGYYIAQPESGLAAARMAALLTYRSRDSFESRFGRRPHKLPVRADAGIVTPPLSPANPADEALAAHNDGLRNPRPRTPALVSADGNGAGAGMANGSDNGSRAATPSVKPIFSAQSYLRYQGDKFVARFDANCYIAITRKMDTHDIARGRFASEGEDEDEGAALVAALGALPPRALVIGIETDGLFTIGEQRTIAAHVPGAELVVIYSPDGHDGFLLEFKQINGHILSFLKRELAELYTADAAGDAPEEGFEITKTSVFGEAEADVTRW